MKKIAFTFVFACLLVFTGAGSDTVKISNPRIPVLTDRQDNILFYLKIYAEKTKTLDRITMRFGKEVKPGEIKAVKLYYGGTESVQRENGDFYSPVQYIPRDAPGKTRSANASYSVKKAETDRIKSEVTLTAAQQMTEGVHYFWVSLELQPTASLLSRVSADVRSVVVDGKEAYLMREQKEPVVRYAGIGIRHAGDDNAAAYRIPGLATSNKGTLLGVYDVRYNNGADLQEYVNIGLSRSTDGGQTWEPMRIIMDFGEYGGLPKAQNGVGDPAILVDRVTGTIWVVAAWTHGMGNGRAWHNSRQGMDIRHTAQLVLVKSEDDGRTWSEPINITSQLKDSSWYFLLQGPGSGITMEDGTLVFASQYIGADRVPNAGIMYSKDHGKTWQIHRHARTNTTEAQVVETEPGVLMLNMRDNRGGSRAVATTRDMGMTWEEHPSSRSALQEPVCMASLLRVRAEENELGRDILLFSNPNTTQGRKNITIKASLDGGQTWHSGNQLLLDEGSGWGYSCLSMVDRGSVGILYESSVAHMTFQAVRLTDIIRHIE